MANPYVCTTEAAPKIAAWLQSRDGIAIWLCVDLSRAGETATTPLRDASGQPVSKPGWQYAAEPMRIITDPAEVQVAVDKEVKRFHVAVRRGGQGLSFKCTNVSSKRIRQAVEKAGVGAYYVFDYETQEVVIMAPERVVGLVEWMAESMGCEVAK